MFVRMYDIIGDIHGHAAPLEALLHKLGYTQGRDGCYRQAGRKAVFVGDLLDRGPQVRETVRIVRRMCQEGAAYCTLGNHEFNFIGYQLQLPGSTAAAPRYAREHSNKNTRQVAATLQDYHHHPDQLAEDLAWLRSLPFWLELPNNGPRIVHACWDENARHFLQLRLGGNRLQEPNSTAADAFWQAAHTFGTPEFLACELLLKGKELNLPDNDSYFDNDGTLMRSFRLRWWENLAGKTYAELAFPAQQNLPNRPVPRPLLQWHLPYPEDAPHVFVGHYWLPPARAFPPRPLTPNVACVDYSIAKKGALAAYRWNGEAHLRPENFVTVGYEG